MSVHQSSPYSNGVSPNGSLPTRQDPSLGELQSQREARTQLFVGNLPFRVRWQDLKDLMRKCGTVLRVDVALTPEGRSRGFGVVLFGRIEDAQKAIELYNGYSWQTRILDVRLDSEEGTVISSSHDPSPYDHLGSTSNSPSPNILPRVVPNFDQAANPNRPRISPPLVPSPRVSSAKIVNSAPILGPQSQSNPHEGAPRDYWYPQQHQQSFGGPPQMQMQQMGMMGMGGMGPPPPMGMGMMNMQGYAPFIAPTSHGYPGMMGGYPPPRPGPPPINPAHMNRHVFVGNLPFNCQWQELKDLMRSAGAVLRADIAQGTDGRSRGFGSILFSSPQDADRAVQMFNGYDYNGRALKVHFDKFSQTSTGPSPAPLYMPYPPPDAFPNNSYNIGVNPNDQRQHQYQSWSLPRGPDSAEFSVGDGSEGARTEVASSFGHAQGRSGESSATSEGMGNEEGIVDKDPTATAATMTTTTARLPYRHTPSMRIGMPPPYPFAGPTSPMTGRLPPMTPSMPAFTLGAFPQTPPLYPQFFSPGLGLGAFSPPMGSPHWNHGGHFMNPAPGAPIHHNPMFPNIAMSPHQPTLSEPSYFPAIPISSPTTPDEVTPTAVAGMEDAVKGMGNLALEVPIVSHPSSSTLSATSSADPTPTDVLAPPIVPASRRRSFVSPTAGGEEREKAAAVRRDFEGKSGGRRNSFEGERAATKKSAFGASSIWAE